MGKKLDAQVDKTEIIEEISWGLGEDGNLVIDLAPGAAALLYEAASGDSWALDGGNDPTHQEYVKGAVVSVLRSYFVGAFDVPQDVTPDDE